MHDLIIIGAGPAGLTAALYAGRFRLDTLLLEKFSPGGQIIFSPSLDNYPGFPGGIAASELIDKMKTQVEEVGVILESREVVSIERGKPAVFRVVTDSTVLETRSIILATGAYPKKLNVPGEDALVGRGVSYCATCDAPLFRNKDVVVLGGGDRAVEEALFLTSYCRQVLLIHRRNALRASAILEEKAHSNPKVDFVLESVLEEIKGTGSVEAVVVRNVSTNVLTEVTCQGVFIFVGIRPNTAFLKNVLRLDEGGFIITDQSMATSEAGIFACGDCRQKSLYQVISACADGAVAADAAHKYLMNL